MSNSFRADILKTNNEASIFGVLSVKGVAIIVLTGLFLGGLIWSLSNSKRHQSNELTIALSNVQASHLNEIKLKTENIETTLLNFYTNEYVPKFAENFAEQIPTNLNLDAEIKNIIAASSSENIKSFRSSLGKLHQLRDECYSNMRGYHAQILKAVQEDNKEEYERLMNNRPQFLIDLTLLESLITDNTSAGEQKLNDYLKSIGEYLNTEYKR